MADAGEQLMATHPIGQLLYFHILPDGVHGPEVQGIITERDERWGLRHIRVALVSGGGGHLEFAHAYNWLGRLRLWWWWRWKTRSTAP